MLKAGRGVEEKRKKWCVIDWIGLNWIGLEIWFGLVWFMLLEEEEYVGLS